MRLKLEGREDEVAACREFLETHIGSGVLRVIKTLRRDSYSYMWKHRVEGWQKKRRQPPYYVCNDAFVAAAVSLGIPHKVTSVTPCSTNCVFALTWPRGKHIRILFPEF